MDFVKGKSYGAKSYEAGRCNHTKLLTGESDSIYLLKLDSLFSTVSPIGITPLVLHFKHSRQMLLRRIRQYVTLQRKLIMKESFAKFAVNNMVSQGI